LQVRVLSPLSGALALRDASGDDRAMRPVIVGFGLGFFVAAQLGPLSLFLIRSTLRGTLQVGLAIGAGIAAIDGLYAALGAAGAAPVLSIDALRTAFGLLGAAVLVVLGARTVFSAFRVRSGLEAAEEVASPRKAFLTSLAATASNPLTIASWAAVFAAASTASVAGGSDAAAVLLVAGVGIGSLTWCTLLACGVAAARRWVGPRLLQAVDIGAGGAITGFGGLLAWRTLRDG
jgi:putative LysE/RhtB family amino acid efflux pump